MLKAVRQTVILTNHGLLEQVLKPGLQKGPWTEEEDQIVMQTVMKYGVSSPS
jgi:hypothetical protein